MSTWNLSFSPSARKCSWWDIGLQFPGMEASLGIGMIIAFLHLGGTVHSLKILLNGVQQELLRALWKVRYILVWNTITPLERLTVELQSNVHLVQKWQFVWKFCCSLTDEHQTSFLFSLKGGKLSSIRFSRGDLYHRIWWLIFKIFLVFEEYARDDETDVLFQAILHILSHTHTKGLPELIKEKYGLQEVHPASLSTRQVLAPALF